MTSGFNRAFAIPNWIQYPSAGMTIITTPISIQFDSDVTSPNADTYMNITIPYNCVITFDWSFTPDTQRNLDPFGYYTDSTLVFLTNRITSPTVTPVSGSVSLYLTSGTIFKFFKRTNNTIPSTALITNFTHKPMTLTSFTNGFTGIFDVDNWTTFQPPTGINITMNSSQINLESTSTPVSGGTDGLIFIEIPQDLVVTFDWQYTGQSPTFDWFAVYINDSSSWLTNSTTTPLSGSVGLYLPAGSFLKFYKHASADTQSMAVVNNFKFAFETLPPCFALSNLIKYNLPKDASIIKKNVKNTHWININGLYLTKDHVVKVNNELLLANQVSNNIVINEDDVVDIYTVDGRFIIVNDIEVATSKS